MTVASGECEAAVAALRSDPSLAGLCGSDSICLFWDRSGTRLLWASERAAALAAALTDADKGLDCNSPLGRLLHRLAAGQGSRDTTRLERVRLGAGAIEPPTTFACRRAAWAGGEGLLTCVVGALPKLGRVPARTAAEAPSDSPSITAAQPAGAQERIRDGAAAAEPARRFLWQTDSEGRFTTISDGFVAMLAAGTDEVLGRTWQELDGNIVADPDGTVAAGFAGHAPWSHARSLWQLPDHKLLPATLSGSPVLEQGGFAGYRGFGRFRVSEIQPGDIKPEPSDEAEQAPAPEAIGQEEQRTPTAASVAGSSAMGPSAPEAVPNNQAVAADEQEPPPGKGAPYKTTYPLHPMFQAMLDASLSGLSQLMGGRPQPAPEQHQDSKPDEIAQAPADEAAPDPNSDEVGPATEADPGPERPAQPSSGEEEQHPPASEQSDQRSSPGPIAFGGLQTRIDAEFGPRQAPLQLAATGLAEGQDADRPASPERSGLDSRPVLSFSERGAFHEIARALGARLDLEPEPGQRRESADVIQLIQPRLEGDALRLLDRLPLGILVYRGDTMLFGNRHLLELAGYADLPALMAAGGLSALFHEGVQALQAESQDGAAPKLTTRLGRDIPISLQCAETVWRDSPASLALLASLSEEDPQVRLRELKSEVAARTRQLDEARAVLDLAADGMVTLDGTGRILSLNGSAETLFGYAQGEIAGEDFGLLLAPETHAAALRALEAARHGEGQTGPVELIGRPRQGEPLALAVSFGRAGAGEGAAICAILRKDVSVRQVEAALTGAKRASDRANRQAADFLARISHEVRTPLNAIIGFAEVMIEERFGPVGTERYKSYLADIRDSGSQVIKLVDDLVDLANAITGRFDIPEQGLDLNEAVIESVAALQTTAARARIVVRTGFANALPGLFVDARSLRQIIDNILSNAIRFTEAGGQVIASTAVTDRGDIALRIRDTGIGMSEEEVDIALEPFREASTLRTGGRGLGLPLAKALVEANRGTMTISSRPGEGTLVEILFPSASSRAEDTGSDEAARRRNA